MFIFLQETLCKNSNSGPWEEAKSSNFAPLKNALMPYVNREAGRSFFWGPFWEQNLSKMGAGSVQVCDYIFEDVKKRHQMEF